MDAMHKFVKIGLNVCSYPDPHFMNIIASHATIDDVLFAVSHTGESLEVLSTVTIAKKTRPRSSLCRVLKIQPWPSRRISFYPAPPTTKNTIPKRWPPG